MKIRNINIINQLNAGFGFILLLILFLSFLAWHMSSVLARQTIDLYNHPHAVRQAVGSLRADVLLIQRGMKDLALTEKEGPITNILLDMDSYKADVQKQFEILYDRYLGPMADIDSASSNFVRWNANREETIILLRKGNIEEVINRTRLGGAGSQQAQKMLDNIRKIDLFSSAKSAEFYQHAVDLNRNLKIKLLIAVSAVLALTILITRFISKNIKNPLEILTEAARKFKEGKRNARSSYGFNNEFGILSRVYNEMADTIESELSLNEQSANITSIMLGEDDTHLFSTRILSALLEYTGGQMGVIYFLNEEKTQLELFETIGLSLKESFISVSIYEGDLGKSIASKKIQYIEDISDQTIFSYAAVSGTFKPKEMITIPLFVKNELIAVISLASITPFRKNSLPLLQSIYHTLSARIDGILSYRKIVDFSNRLEGQNRELESQATELKQQSVELGIQKRRLNNV